MRALFLLVPVCFLLAGAASAQEVNVSGVPPMVTDTAIRIDLTLPPPVRRQLDAFFGTLGQNQVGEAYDALMKGSKLAGRAKEMEYLQEKTQQAITLYGNVIGYDLLAVKHVGPHLLLATCVSLGKEFPLRWKFSYFSPSDAANWRLVDIRVDDQLADMFGERPPAPAAPASAAP